MKIAPEFRHLATCFHQRSDLEYDNPEDCGPVESL